MGGFESEIAAKDAKNNALGALAMFILTFAVSLYGLYFQSKNDESYVEDFEMMRPLTPSGMSTYKVDSERVLC